MLSMSSYSEDWIERCGARTDSRVARYQELRAAVEPGDALASFEPAFFNNLVFTLGSYFLHRSRTIEGKDGNALNEVRILCNSVTSNGSLFGTHTAAVAPWNP
jgi:hypothetical protein